MSFKLIAMGNSQQITSYFNLMQLNTGLKYKLIYKQVIDKNELLVVWDYKQRYHPETFSFPLIYVQAQDQDGVEQFSLRDTQVIHLGSSDIFILESGGNIVSWTPLS